MQNSAFEKLGLEYCYLPVEVTEENLKEVFKGLCHMNVGGFNVTIPHKIKIIDYLDKLDPLAATIGAVNTICIKDGKTIGYNTDGEGFLLSLENKTGVTIKDKSIFLLGAGGAGRAISMTLAYHGAERIFISNRTHAKAEALAAEINDKIRDCAEAVIHTDSNRKKILNRCDVLINSTSIGMHPKEDALPIEESLIQKHLVVADIVYNPLLTKLLRIATINGCSVVHGLGMLVHQGAAGFALWTGVEPDVQEISRTVEIQMREK
jgi:shikimate dehydrogenase